MWARIEYSSRKWHTFSPGPSGTLSKQLAHGIPPWQWTPLEKSETPASYAQLLMSPILRGGSLPRLNAVWHVQRVPRVPRYRVVRKLFTIELQTFYNRTFYKRHKLFTNGKNFLQLFSKTFLAKSWKLFTNFWPGRNFKTFYKLSPVKFILVMICSNQK